MSGLPERDLDPEELEQEEAFGESASDRLAAVEAVIGSFIFVPADCDRRLVFSGFFHSDIYDHMDRECFSVCLHPSERERGGERESEGQRRRGRERARERRRPIEGQQGGERATERRERATETSRERATETSRERATETTRERANASRMSLLAFHSPSNSLPILHTPLSSGSADRRHRTGSPRYRATTTSAKYTRTLSRTTST
jgi:hypothetical protein